jgi:hypothetical protein
VKLSKWIAAGAVLALAACGPADVNQAAQDAASTAGVAVPSDAAEQAASALASAGALIDASTEAAINEAIAGLSATDLEALGNEAVTAVQGLTPDDLRLQADQPLVLDTTKEVADVTNYRWVITQAPAGAEAVKGAVISENSNGKLTIEPTDYAKYFPVAGNYTVDLELTYANGSKERSPIDIVVP